MYGEDDPALTAIILTKANDPAVFVQVNLDKTQAAGRAEVPLVAQLRACPNTRVAVGMSANHLINHLKMAVVDGIYTLTGSTNWSSAGEGDGKGHGQNNEASIIKSRVIAHEATMKLNADHQIMLAQETSTDPPASVVDALADANEHGAIAAPKAAL
jgi:phosphatidylserine/phosphatidylglycerophosphate/cardiolipin synthase-like enzyme